MTDNQHNPTGESDETAGAVSEDKGAGAGSETLADILREFSDSASEDEADDAPKAPQLKSEARTPAKADTAEDPRLSVLEQTIESLQRKEARKELDVVLSRIKGSTDIEPEVLEAYIEGQARKNPDLQRAYVNRGNNPAAWAKVEARLAKDVAERFGVRVDRPVTEARDAIAAAVRGSSSTAPKGDISDREIMEMDADEFRKLQARFGVRPV